ncbi:MAG: bifunctional DNA-formamidopyrimidine glycosylase/DNA-(apurinic or apyrimidinic site) lyase [Hyphomicrobiales bacterium]|nr:MAG: bifunctional DNA-formamidopyrimidine glycosylase/DNA-(apurinic or apyrimidinic site) lyase [Hyphomicrobiales bacterium]|tara:strand:- start:1673 stop:2521 length:849 start_codon:yes stop_codon:yes gene_type:complete
MPELPEVEIIKNNLSDYLVNKTFHSIKVFTSKLRYKIPHNLVESVKNQRVTHISRVAKYIIVSLDNNYALLIHLGMTGNFLINTKKKNQKDRKHVRLSFVMSDESKIDYVDIRKFGFFKLVTPQKNEIRKLLAELGPDALSDEFNTNYLQGTLKNRTINIKSALLNQKIVGGIGNIYASEALFRAKISPITESRKIAKDKIKISDLVSSIKFILNDAIKVGGSTIKDHKNLKGESGYFQYKFNVYNRENMECNDQNCDSKIKRIVQTGRSSFYCEKCQKMGS